MLCSQAIDLFSLQLDDELAPDAASALREHLSGCADCARGFFDLRDSLAALRSLPDRSADDLPRRLMPAMAPAALRGPWRWRRTTTALAAALVVTASLSLGLAPAPTGTPTGAEGRLAGIEAANATLARLASDLNAELAAERAHRAQGETWIDGRWRPRGEALPTLIAEEGLVERHGLLLDHQALDALEAGKVLSDGRWMPVDEVVAAHLGQAGLEPAGRSWLAPEDRQGLLAEGRRVDPERWVGEHLAAQGYELGGDGRWRQRGETAAPAPVAAPAAPEPTAAQSADALAQARLREEQERWLAVPMLPGFSARPAAMPDRELASVGAKPTAMNVSVDRNRLKPSPFAPGPGLTGWRVTVTADANLGTPAIAGQSVHVGGGLSSTMAFAFDRVSGAPRWSATLADNGPSSPAVIGDCIAYTTESCTLYELDRDTGKPVFARWIAGSLQTMPGVLGSTLVTTAPFNGGYALVGFDRAAGSKRRWAAPLPADLRTAPIGLGDRLIGATHSGAVLCWRASDGRELWRDQIGAISAPSTLDGRIMIRRAVQCPVATGQAYGETLSVLDPGDGTFVDTMLGTPRALVDDDSASSSDPTPLVAENGRVRSYPSLGPAVAAQGLAISVRGDVLEAITVANGQTAWQVQLGRPEQTGRETHSDPCIAGGCVLVGTLDGCLLAIDLATGAQRWSAQIGAPMGNSLASAPGSGAALDTMCRVRPIALQGRIYITTRTGDLVCVDSGDRSLNGARWWGDTL